MTFTITYKSQYDIFNFYCSVHPVSGIKEQVHIKRAGEVFIVETNRPLWKAKGIKKRMDLSWINPPSNHSIKLFLEEEIKQKLLKV